MNPISNCCRRVYNWIKLRLICLWDIICYLACCACCDGGERNDVEKGVANIRSSDIQSNLGEGHKKSTMDAGGAGRQVHKVIMVGSGGVGKSALTLQFMYDEVGFIFKNSITNNSV